MVTAVLCLVALLNAVQAHNTCFVQYTSSLQFSIKSEVNETGQRFVMVELLGEARHPEPLGLSVNHWTARFEGLEVVGVKVNATVPVDARLTPARATIEAETAALASGTTAAAATRAPPSVATSTAKPSRRTTTARPTTSTTTVNPDSVCRPGYKVVAGVGCYKGNRTLLKWEQARLSCATEGAALATPDTRRELDGMWRIADTLPLWPWVGIHRPGESWLTVEGGPIKFPTWAPGEPSGGGKCVIVYSDGLINNLCSTARPFICEHRIP